MGILTFFQNFVGGTAAFFLGFSKPVGPESLLPNTVIVDLCSRL